MSRRRAVGRLPSPALLQAAWLPRRLAATTAPAQHRFLAGFTVVLQKQGDNPAFAFLKGGEGADYYQAQKESAMRSAPPP